MENFTHSAILQSYLKYNTSFGEIRQWICLKTGILEIPMSTLCSIVDLPHDLRRDIPSLDILEKGRQTFVRSVFCIFSSVLGLGIN